MVYAMYIYIRIRILQDVISGIPLILALGTRMRDPYVYVVFFSLVIFASLSLRERTCVPCGTGVHV